jgi:hypothetical protein
MPKFWVRLSCLTVKGRQWFSYEIPAPDPFDAARQGLAQAVDYGICGPVVTSVTSA